MFNWRGKVCGVLLGGYFLGPLGVLLGFWLGHLFDQNFLPSSFRKTHRFSANKAQQTFFKATFMLMGYIAKADGHVSSQEIAVTEKVIQQFRFTATQRQEAIRWFNEGKQNDFSWQKPLDELRQTCGGNHALLQLFMDLQRQIAHADGLTAPKQNMLRKIGDYIGCSVSAADAFSDFFQEAYQQQQRQQYQTHHGRQRQYQNTYQTPQIDPYAVLGISRQTSKADVKKAYRKLMSQHHPDKLVAQGLPPEMIKAATEKTQAIQNAYQKICEEQGI